MVLETYFKELDISIEILTNELTVFYNEYDTIQHVVQGLIKEGCLGQRYKSYSGTILTDKTYDLYKTNLDGYVIYEYRKTFSGFSPADASGGGSGPSPPPSPTPTPGPSPSPSPESKCVPCKLNKNNARTSVGPCCSALALATSWVNTVDCDSCPYALAISFGEGNDLQTASSTDPLAGINSGFVPDCKNHPEEECPAAFPMSYLKPNGGPFQVQSITCDINNLDCYNKQALQYIKDNCKTLRPTMKYIFGKDIASKGDEYTWCGCNVDQPESSTPGFNGSCSSQHKNKDYYTNMLPTAQKVCKRVPQCSQHIF